MAGRPETARGAPRSQQHVYSRPQGCLPHAQIASGRQK